MKKDSGLFDVALLHKLSEKDERENLALYHDDALEIFKNDNELDSEKVKKHYCKLFIDHDLELTIQCNRKAVNFLDVILNLENLTYHPYLKDNHKIIYVNTESNHPPSKIKQLPTSIELILSQLSANEEMFKNSVRPCNEALGKAGHKHQMRYQQNMS